MKTKPQYPIYVISKSRWESRLTVKMLERNGTPYRVVIEPTEYDQYASVINPNNILVLPFHDLGQGSIPARNWVWEHSIEEGHEKHWILDDNIRDLYRLNRNRKYRVRNSVPFRICEDFTNRYSNVALSGLNYQSFAPRNAKKAPFYYNTRVYSCILIRNDIEMRWRGRYNEDTDLSLRALKAGWCTILLNSFLCDKIATLKMKGGNTDTVYATGDKRMEFAKSLKEQHPDVTEVVWRYDRWHHEVDYTRFQKMNKLKFREGFKLPKGINEYNLELKNINELES